MKDEYIIINKTELLKELEGLEKDYFKVKGNDDADEHFLDGRRTSFKEMLSKSTPLKPEIELAIIQGIKLGKSNSVIEQFEMTQYYIQNLKLDI